jgi:2-iminobutanoate/2-iminopropanoate deaminase
MTTTLTDEQHPLAVAALRARMAAAANEWRTLDRRCAELGLMLAHPGTNQPLNLDERRLLADRDATWLTYLQVREEYAALCGGHLGSRHDAEPAPVTIGDPAAAQGRSDAPVTTRRITVRSAISIDTAPVPIGCYSQGFARGGIIAVSGQVGVDPQTGAMVEGGVAAQTRQALENIQAVLAAEGASWPDVIKLGVYLATTADAGRMNTAFEMAVPRPYPSRTTVSVSLPDGVLVEIDALAVKPPIGDDAGERLPAGIRLLR